MRKPTVIAYKAIVNRRVLAIARRGGFALGATGLYGCLKGNGTLVVKTRRRKYARDMAKRTISVATLAAVGARLRMLRAVVGHTQANWAYRLRISPQILNKWEQGARQPNIETLVLICGSTGCTLDFIFRGHVGADMKQELREPLLNSYRDDPLVFELFSPAVPPSSPSSPAPKPRRRARPVGAAAPRRKK